MDSSAISRSSLELTYGAYLIGVIVSVALYGVTVVQTYIYFRRNERDPRWLKRVVLGLWLMDTTHKATLCQSLYEFVVLEFGNPSAITSPTWSFWTSILITNTIEITVRCLLSYRLYMVSKRWWIAVPIILLSFCHFIGVLVYVIIEVHHTVVVTTDVTTSILYFAGACGCCSDVSLATCQTILLRRLRSGFKASNKVIQIIVLYSVNTCIITCMVTILCVVTASLDGQHFTWLSLYHQLGTLLLNALLATYNARQELREAINERGDLITIHFYDLPSSNGEMLAGADGHDNYPIQISVMTSAQTEADSLPEDAFVNSKRAPSVCEEVYPA